MHTTLLASELACELERRGFVLVTCGTSPARCGVLHGGTCQAAEDADVIVCDGGDDGWRVPRLVEALRARHPRLPIVIAGRALERAVLEALGEPWVASFVGVPTAARLSSTIDEAMGGIPEAMLGIVG
jgi:hypothetical protein